MRRTTPSARLRRAAFVPFAVLLALFGLVVPAQAAEPPGPVQPELRAQLDKDGKADFWVEFKEQAALTSAPAIRDWAERGAAVVAELRATAQASQGRARELVRAASARSTSLYIDNSLYVHGGSAELAGRLAADPAVERVRLPRTYRLPEPSPGERVAAAGQVEWGISAIHADQVWSEYGSTGQGIVVGNIDSGVDVSHPALAAAYRGANGDGTVTHDHNFYDPTGLCDGPAPCDNFGHGTHTMGTMVGAGGIGVAPGARWIAAKGCRDFQCAELTLALAAQWMLAPTEADGSNPDPAKRPDILNNSWSSGPGDPWYQDYVREWVAAGIFPAFAVGNDGSACGTQHSPGEYPESYAVGAVDQNGDVAWFSSRGEAGSPDSKPDIVAPGQNVRSSTPGGTYQVQNGTSMATPHVSGAVALMWSAAPALKGDVAATRAILDATAHDHADTTCGGTAGDNNVYGEGMLDVHAAVGASPRTGTGVLAGTVTDKSTGKPVAGARVSATGPRTLETTTGADGAYRLHLDEGDYDVRTSLFGYDDASLLGVHVTEGKTVSEDVALAPARTAKVTVRVADGSGHGWPLYAGISVEGASRTWFTAPGDGRASLDLPVGATYQVTATPRYPGYRPVTQQVTVEAAGEPSAGLTADLTAEIDAQTCAAPGYAAGDGTCAPVAGGLVYGAVTDANTREPVDTATVTPAGGTGNDTAATPDDPTLPDGFYWVFAPVPASGDRLLTAAQRGYQTASEPVKAGADQVSRIDFALKAGRLSVSTEKVSERARLGERERTRLTITNRGTAPVTYDLAESRQSPVLRGQGAPARRIETSGLSPAAITAPGTGATAEGGPEGGAEGGPEGGPEGGAEGGAVPAAAPWTDISDYPTTIRDNAVGYLDGKVYSFGGSLRGEGGTPASYVYDPLATAWTRIADMPEARQKPASAFVDGRFYVVAGWGPQGAPSARTLVYDPKTDTWSSGADSPHPWGAVGSAVLDGRIYAVGGCAGDCQTATDQVTVYDVANDRFTAAAPYPEPISWAACGGIDGRVYCAGGLAAGPHGTTRAYVYDPARDAWDKAADLPLDLWGSSYAVAGGKLLVAGGVTKGGSTLTNEAFAYDPDADVWTALPNSRNALFRGAAACGFYKIGGADGPRVTPYSEVLPGYDGCDPAGTDAPWLSADPARGTLAPGRSARVTLTLDARELAQPGTYAAGLTIVEDTPYPAPRIGVTLEAEAPWHWAHLSGQVRSKACDGTASPLPGATVTVRRGRDTWTVGTDGEGRYSLWIKGGVRRTELAVTADGHRPAEFGVRPLPHREVRRDATLSRTDC
ncbi:S8 family serine peptidase [Nonomuraea phyllanthi]|uniref:S8 family serine peptidase n=1 Tax=Nonomuraea phyllanthi TaxID=2219224 RepID=A0A5C4WP97_9ACTN|nr:S8 family serine peptidase [Nonomuraea phyllanthi]KAB8195434.1 S8 family serine peptidase [Nonomuraea phyllanthi]